MGADPLSRRIGSLFQPSRRFIGIGARLVEGDDGFTRRRQQPKSRGKGNGSPKPPQTSKNLPKPLNLRTCEPPKPPKTSKKPLKRVSQHDNHPTEKGANPDGEFDGDHCRTEARSRGLRGATRPRSPGPAGRRSRSPLVVNYEEGSELAIGDGDRDARAERAPPAGHSPSATWRARGRFEYGLPRRLLAVARRLSTSREVKCTFLRLRLSPWSANRDGPPRKCAGTRSWTSCRTAIAGEDRLAADARAGARAYPSRRRLHRRDDGRAPARLVLAAMARSVAHARAGGRGGAAFLFDLRTPTTTTCRTGRWSATRSTW